MNPNRSNTTTMKNPINILIQPFLNKNTIMIVTSIICPIMMAAFVNELVIEVPAAAEEEVVEEVEIFT